MEGELTCGICLEFFENPLMLPCSHNFCKKCLEGIINAKQNYRLKRLPGVHIDCPLCQRHYSLENGLEGLPGNLTLENIISHYKTKGTVPFSDVSWDSDINIAEGTCKMHSLPMTFYCLTCDASVCKQCPCYSSIGTKTPHRCSQIKEHSSNLQASISSKLTEVRKKVTPLNDRIQLLEDIVRGIDENQKKVEKQLELEIASLISLLRSRQEELTRLLGNDILDIRRPVEDHLRRYKNLQTTIQEHLKKLSMVKGTKDLSLRIKLMQESEKQLSSLLCFDLAWFSSNDMPSVDMPAWILQKHSIDEIIPELSWQKTGGDGTRLLTPLLPLPAVSPSEPVASGYSSTSRGSSAERDLSELAKPIVPGFESGASGFSSVWGSRDSSSNSIPETSKAYDATGLESFFKKPNEASNNQFSFSQSNPIPKTSSVSMFAKAKPICVASGGTTLFSLSLPGDGGRPNILQAPTCVTMTSQVSTYNSAKPQNASANVPILKLESSTNSNPGGANARQGETTRNYPVLTSSDFVPQNSNTGKVSRKSGQPVQSDVVMCDQAMDTVEDSVASSICVTVNTDTTAMSSIASGLHQLSLSESSSCVPVVSPSVYSNVPFGIKFPVFSANSVPASSGTGIYFRVSGCQPTMPYSPPTVDTCTADQAMKFVQTSNANFNAPTNVDESRGDNPPQQMAIGGFIAPKTESPSVTTLTFGVIPKTNSNLIFPGNTSTGMFKPVTTSSTTMSSTTTVFKPVSTIALATPTTKCTTTTPVVSRSATIDTTRSLTSVPVSIDTTQMTRRLSAPVMSTGRTKCDSEGRSTTDASTHFADGLPKLSARDFSPTRTGSPPRTVTYRRIVKPKNKLLRK